MLRDVLLKQTLRRLDFFQAFRGCVIERKEFHLRTHETSPHSSQCPRIGRHAISIDSQKACLFSAGHRDSTESTWEIGGAARLKSKYIGGKRISYQRDALLARAYHHQLTSQVRARPTLGTGESLLPEVCQ